MIPQRYNWLSNDYDKKSSKKSAYLKIKRATIPREIENFQAQLFCFSSRLYNINVFKTYFSDRFRYPIF